MGWCALLLHLLATVRDMETLVEGSWRMVGLIWAHPDFLYGWRRRLIHWHVHEPLLRRML